MTESGSIVTVPKFLSTGLPTIDHMLGGGIPAGRITELFSKGEGVGKSSLAAMLMAEMQRRGGTVLLMDTEHGFTNDRLKTFGVDPENIIKVEPTHIENACQVISDTIKYLKQHDEKSDKVLIVWDSVTGTVSKQEAEAEYEDIQVASSARALSTVIKKLKDEIAKTEVYVICIVQTRQNIGGGPFSEKHQAAGGQAIKYYAGQRIVMYKGANSRLKEGTTILGFKVSMHTEKSRLAAPYQKATAALFFEEGWDRWKSLFDLLLTLKVVKQKGGYYEIEGHPKSFRQGEFEKVLGGLGTGEKSEIKEKLRDARLTEDAIEYFLP
jgi:recombination protein RecA